jgi:hypothetical protein
MKWPGLLLFASLPVMLAATTATPVPSPPEAPPAAAAAAPTKPASDYTSDATYPPLVSEYDPATAPPPMYAEPPDEDGVRQCYSPEGVPVFTDRRCADLGASPLAPPPAMGEGASLTPRVRSCARNQSMLLDGVRAALESHDANRLADYYHWTGMDSKSGYQMMERLDAFSARQVVDVRLVRNAAPEGPPDPFADRFDPLPVEPAPAPEDAAPAPDGTAPPGSQGNEAPRPAPRRALASMLRVDQMRSADDVAANITYFHLLTNAGCWWMRF